MDKNDQPSTETIQGWTVSIDAAGICEIRDDKGHRVHKSGGQHSTAAHLVMALQERRKHADQPAGGEVSGCELPTRRLFLDCDGVLADFDKAFVSKFGHTPRDYEDKNGAEVFWRDIKAECPTFYRDLPLMPDAMELFEAVKHLRPIILTGVPRGEWAELQKLAWAAEHFPGVPMIVCKARDKCNYLLPGDVLIDDRTQYRDRWEQAGGVFIHHTSAKESLAVLRRHWHPAPASELAELRAEVERLRIACSKQNATIEQTLGKALGYPQMYEADGKIVAPDCPGAKPIDQVCVGEHVAETLAEEAASKIATLTAQLAAWKEEWQMYANAWKREVSGFIPPKTHLIDALVLATRELKKRHDAALAAKGADANG